MQIIQKPILFNAERIKLTRAYRFYHYNIQSRSIKIIPQMIVLHSTDTKNLEEAFKDFYNPALLNRPELENFGALNVSAHYIVDRDGKIYQLMPDNFMARHIIGLNNIAIGIENVWDVHTQKNLTHAQAYSNACLILMLRKKYPTIKYLIGHYEYKKYRNTPLWEDQFPGYITPKKDPGEEFMKQVRALVK